MLDDLFYPNERKSLWTKEMVILSLSNVLLYASLYIFLPFLPMWISKEVNCDMLSGALIMSSFAFAIFIPGPFNNYLLDAFKRKKVGSWAFILLSVSSFIFLYSSSLIPILAIRICQGIFFSIIITATGSTLVIDVTPTQKRTLANLAYARFGRLGMALGVILGLFVSKYYDLNYVVYISCIMSLVSGIMLLMIRVPFRAPLKPSFCSLDRFILPRALPVALNMIFIPLMLGFMISSIHNELFYIELVIGFILSYLCFNVVFKSVGCKREIEQSVIFMIFGYALFMIPAPQFISTLSVIMIGMGMGISANRFYLMIISVPLHCERGSANNTYCLIWELGLFIGIIAGCLISLLKHDYIFISSIIISIVLLLIYELFLHKWYYLQMDKKQQ